MFNDIGNDNFFKKVDDRWVPDDFCYSASTSYLRVRVNLDKEELAKRGGGGGVDVGMALKTEDLGHLEAERSPDRHLKYHIKAKCELFYSHECGCVLDNVPAQPYEKAKYEERRNAKNADLANELQPCLDKKYKKVDEVGLTISQELLGGYSGIPSIFKFWSCHAHAIRLAMPCVIHNQTNIAAIMHMVHSPA